jgi:hypothetical protein
MNQLEHVPERILGGNTLGTMHKILYLGISGLRVGILGSPMVPLDRARRGVLGTLSNSVGTHPWANPRWKYLGNHAENPVFGVFGADGLRGSGRRGYGSIELVEEYLEHYLTQLEHIPGRILGGNTSETMRKTQYLGISGLRVGILGSPIVPLDRARRGVLGTLSNSVGTPPWANPRWNYSGRVLCPMGKIQYLGLFGRMGLEVWVADGTI